MTKDKVKYHLAVCKYPEFRIRQDEPYSQMQIRIICSMYDVKYFGTRDAAGRDDLKFYVFRRE